MRILIADDHDLLRDTLVMFLEGTGGMTTETAQDLPGALKTVAEDGPFDVVILDFNMPGMNGLDATQTIKSAHPEARIIIITQLDTPGFRKAAEKAGACAFVAKDDLHSLAQLLQK